MKHIFLISLLAVTLSACQTPTTKRPAISRDELIAEQAEQQRMADQVKAQGGVPKNWQTPTGAKKRFERVGMEIEKAGAKICKEMPVKPENGCYYFFKLNMSDEDVNAHADGKNIVVAGGMMRFIESDEELALVMAHEMAHNLLGHISSNSTNTIAGQVLGTLLDIAVATQGVNTQGGFGQLGGAAGLLSYSSQFEAEADYVGMYIAANAGYDYHHVASFWRRMSFENPDAIYVSQTHPSHAERFVALNKTAAEIDEKRARRLPLLPDMIAEQ